MKIVFIVLDYHSEGVDLSGKLNLALVCVYPDTDLKIRPSALVKVFVQTISAGLVCCRHRGAGAGAALYETGAQRGRDPSAAYAGARHELAGTGGFAHLLLSASN